jgi:hypothetical protein
MAVHHFTSPLHPLSSKLLENFVQRVIDPLDSILAESPTGTWEFEDDFFDCGAVATVTEVESERHYWLRHFRAINLNAKLMKVRTPQPEPLLKFNHDVLNTTNQERS